MCVCVCVCVLCVCIEESLLCCVQVDIHTSSEGEKLKNRFTFADTEIVY